MVTKNTAQKIETFSHYNSYVYRYGDPGAYIWTHIDINTHGYIYIHGRNLKKKRPKTEGQPWTQPGVWNRFDPRFDLRNVALVGVWQWFETFWNQPRSAFELSMLTSGPWGEGGRGKPGTLCIDPCSCYALTLGSIQMTLGSSIFRKCCV